MAWRSLTLRGLGYFNDAAAAQCELPRGHIPALDAIRGLAIVLVTLYRFGGGADGVARAIDSPWLIGLGARGVDLFFVLSGFLITGILVSAKGKEGYFRNFYIRRALRIFPLYYGALVLILVVAPFVSGKMPASLGEQAWLWLYGANVLQSIRGAWCLGSLNHFWSLAVEEHFYFVWPLVIFLCPRPVALRVCGCVIAASALARAGWLAAGGNDVAAEVFTLLRMDGLVLGGWLALVARSPGGLAWLVRLARPALVLSGACAFGTFLLGKRLLGLPDLVWAIFFGSLLVLVVSSARESWLARWGNSSTLQFFGKYSYAMYVFQLPLIYGLAWLVTAPGLAYWFDSPLLGQFAYCVIMFGFTTLLALASWHCFEKHFLALKHRFGG
ncbi:MAG TPA: acyltransferase [Pirellulaceae bacterium]|nr:acyltransferase [Pirellulaceae bacterium]